MSCNNKKRLIHYELFRVDTDSLPSERLTKYSTYKSLLERALTRGVKYWVSSLKLERLK